MLKNHSLSLVTVVSIVITDGHLCKFCTFYNLDEVKNLRFNHILERCELPTIERNDQCLTNVRNVRHFCISGTFDIQKYLL